MAAAGNVPTAAPGSGFAPADVGPEALEVSIIGASPGAGTLSEGSEAIAAVGRIDAPPPAVIPAGAAWFWRSGVRRQHVALQGSPLGSAW